MSHVPPEEGNSISSSTTEITLISIRSNVMNTQVDAKTVPPELGMLLAHDLIIQRSEEVQKGM